jgi:hypothetical protein
LFGAERIADFILVAAVLEYDPMPLAPLTMPPSLRAAGRNPSTRYMFPD